jgi:hypothetical protein
MITGFKNFINNYFELGVLISVIFSLVIVTTTYVINTKPTILNSIVILNLLYISFEVIEGVLGWGVERSFWKERNKK